MRWLADEAYTKAEKIRVVLDNLNTHRPASLYETFDPAEARRILKRLEFHYTPMAEIELSVFSRQCHGRGYPHPRTWLNMAEIELSVFSRTPGMSQSEDTRWGYPHPRTGSPGETPQ